MVTGEELRAAMRRFPTGIAVLTVDDDGARLGVTVGSLVSLSLDPPLVGVSLGAHSPLHEPVRRVGRFAVSLLAGDQVSLAQHFARGGMPPLAVWVGVALHDREASGPLLEGALAWLDCEVAAEHSAGDHTFFVAHVKGIELGRRESGLVYVESDYRAA